MPKHNYIRGTDFVEKIAKALEIEQGVRRIVIDAACDGLVYVYVELIGDERLIDLDVKNLSDIAVKVRLDKTDETEDGRKENGDKN